MFSNNITYDFTSKELIFDNLKLLFKNKNEWYFHENNNSIEFIKRHYELDNFKINIFKNHIDLNIPLQRCSFYKKFYIHESNKMIELIKNHI